MSHVWICVFSSIHTWKLKYCVRLLTTNKQKKIIHFYPEDFKFLNYSTKKEENHGGFFFFVLITFSSKPGSHSHVFLKWKQQSVKWQHFSRPISMAVWQQDILQHSLFSWSFNGNYCLSKSAFTFFFLQWQTSFPLQCHFQTLLIALLSAYYSCAAF